jgi:hypothetical protein
MALVPTRRQLDVVSVQMLVEASFKGLRVSVKGEGISDRDLLTGNFDAKSLDCQVRQRGRMHDLVGTYWAGVYLVSERFRTLVAELGATGWHTTQLHVTGVESPLWLLSISGACGPVFGVGGMPHEGIPKFGSFVDPDRWDGSDFYMPDNNIGIHVIGSTAEKIHDLMLSNVAFESAGLEPLRSA